MRSSVKIGVGNSFRRDDGVGPAVVEEAAKSDLPNARVLTATGEPAGLLDAWSDIVDADHGVGLTPSVAAVVPAVLDAVVAVLAELDGRRR